MIDNIPLMSLQGSLLNNDDTQRTMNLLGNFVLPTAPQYHNYKELPFKKDQALPHLAFPFVCGFTVILLFGALGVEDRGLRQIPIVLQAISYRGLYQTGNLPIETEDT